MNPVRGALFFGSPRRSHHLPLAVVALGLILPAHGYGAEVRMLSNLFSTSSAIVDLPFAGPTLMTGLDASNPLFPIPALYSNPIFFMRPSDPLASQVGSAWTDTTMTIGPPFQTGFDMAMDFDFGQYVLNSPSVDLPITLTWLSLKSVHPVFLSPFGLMDVYLGLSSVPQTPGRIEFIERAHGYFGWFDLGRVGVTTDNPADPSFLGLPVTYDAIFIPAGMPETSAPVLEMHGLQTVLHSAPGSGYSGTYDIMPESPSMFLLAGGLLALLGIARFHPRTALRRQ